jgi:hypothetical protein
MFDVKAGIMWVVLFAVLTIGVMLFGGTGINVIIPVLSMITEVTAFICIILVLGEIRDSITRSVKKDNRTTSEE